MRAVEAQSAVLLAATDKDEGHVECGRPDDCACHAAFEDLPCWPCYRDGFELPDTNLEGQ